MFTVNAAHAAMPPGEPLVNRPLTRLGDKP